MFGELITPKPFYFKDGNLIWLKNIKVSSDFLEKLIQFNINKILKTSIGSTQKALTIIELKKIKLFVPTIKEQTKIASFLSAIDIKIEQLAEKKRLLEQYKKGAIQKLFSREIQFKDDKGEDFPEWEDKRLGDLGKTLNGLTGKTKVDFGTGKPYIQYKQVFYSSKIDVSKCDFVEIAENQSKVQFGDVFFTTSSETPDEIGTASVLLDEVDEMYLNSFCFGFRSNLKTLNPLFSQFSF